MRPFRSMVPLLALVALATPRLAAQNAASAPRTVPIRLSEYRIEIADTLTEGQAVLAVTNAGTTPHSFVIRGNRSQTRTPEIAPGASVNIPLRLVVGEYRLYCEMRERGGARHRDQGMEKRVRVVW